MEENQVSSWRKQRWLRIACFFGILWMSAGVSLIALFILQKNLMAVVLTSLIFCVVIQLSYWYCRVKVLQEHRRQYKVRAALIARALENAAASYDPENDKPPSYEEVMKADPPPPLYYEVIRECFSRTRRISASVPSSPTPSLKSTTGAKKASKNNKGGSVAPVHRSNSISCALERNDGTDASACFPISKIKMLVNTNIDRNTERDQTRSSVSRSRIVSPGVEFNTIDPLSTIRLPITKNRPKPLCSVAIHREVN